MKNGCIAVQPYPPNLFWDCWCAAFGARTLDYDADSDSSSSDDELLRSYPEAGGSSAAAAPEASGDGEGEDEFGDDEEVSQEDEDEEDELPVPSSSAQGPIVDIPSGISWWGCLLGQLGTCLLSSIGHARLGWYTFLLLAWPIHVEPWHIACRALLWAVMAEQYSEP